MRWVKLVILLLAGVGLGTLATPVLNAGVQLGALVLVPLGLIAAAIIAYTLLRAVVMLRILKGGRHEDL